MNQATPPNVRNPWRPATLLALIGFIGLNVLVLAIGGLLTSVSVGNWYLTLDRPPWNPTSYLFRIVWPVLYLLFALSMWRLWMRHPIKATRLCFALLGLQLVLNIAWSGVFFALQHIGWGFFILLAIVLLIYPTLAIIGRRDRLAALLLVPYAGWVTFAATLNFAIWRLNGWPL